MTDVASDLDLRGLVRAVLDSGQTDPGVIADAVLASLPEEALREALSMTLRAFVRQMMGAQRNSGAVARATAPSPSWKGQGIRDNWQRRLSDVYHVSTGYKALAACTYDDLIFAATERQELAERNASAARRCRAYATAILDAGVETFGDLPVETKAHLLGGGA